MADLLAQKVQSEYPEGAFVAGLLHDIGLLLIGVAFPEEFAEIRRLHEEQRRPLHECEEEVLGLAHAEISAAALNEWNLPEPVRRAVRYHNEPSRWIGEEYPLSWVLHAADRAVDQFELAVLPEAANCVEDPDEILTPLGLESHWDQLADQFEQEFAPMKSFF
jgi:HD-like signal output (HDOD) protein